MDALQRAVPTPKIEIIEQCAARWKVFRDRSPLATRAQNIHDAVHDFASIDVASVAAALGGRDQRRHMRPFLVRKITRIAQSAAVVSPTVLARPHRWSLSNQATSLESQTIHEIQYVPGQTLIHLKTLVFGAICLELDGAVANLCLEILRRPAGQSWPVRHLAGENDRSIGRYRQPARRQPETICSNRSALWAG
jgi:hypothetical protein